MPGEHARHVAGALEHPDHPQGRAGAEQGREALRLRRPARARWRFDQRVAPALARGDAGLDAAGDASERRGYPLIEPPQRPRRST